MSSVFFLCFEKYLKVTNYMCNKPLIKGIDSMHSTLNHLSPRSTSSPDSPAEHRSCPAPQNCMDMVTWTLFPTGNSTQTLNATEIGRFKEPTDRLHEPSDLHSRRHDEHGYREVALKESSMGAAPLCTRSKIHHRHVSICYTNSWVLMSLLWVNQFLKVIKCAAQLCTCIEIGSHNPAKQSALPSLHKYIS